MGEKGIFWEEATDLASVAAKCDVLYQTRIQKERFLDNPEDYDQAKGKVGVDGNRDARAGCRSAVAPPQCHRAAPAWRAPVRLRGEL